MSDNDVMIKNEADSSSAQSGDNVKKGKRYQGYDLEKTTKSSSGRKRPWFWKVLGISLCLTALIILGVCGYIFRSNKKMTDYISKINDANTMEKLLADHKNVQITCDYSHLAEGEDYKTTRFVKMAKDGDFYSYYKIEGSEEDYKEVIHHKTMYRYDEKFVQNYGLLEGDYENICVADIEGNVFQAAGTEKIQNEKESGNFIKIEATYEVQDGDMYTSLFGFDVGTQIEKSITMDKDSLIVTAETESCDGEEFYSYTVGFDGEEKIPQFYQDLKKTEETRKCYVYYDYDGENEKKYTFDVLQDVYFNLLDHDGYKVYMDEDGIKEFTDYQMQVQNPEGSLTLYMIKDNE